MQWLVANGQRSKQQSDFSESHADECHGLRKIRPNQFSIKPQNPIPQPMERAVPTRISRNAPAMVTTVNLNNKARRRRQENQQ